MNICFSYRTAPNNQPPPRVLEAKLGLEALGHIVFWGLDVNMMGPDWRNQWMTKCDEAEICINFLSARYVQSQACADEWNHAMKNNRAKTINIALGGRACRNAIKALPLQGPGSVAQHGGAGIKMHFTSDGQALSVYDQGITQVIIDQLEKMSMVDVNSTVPVFNAVALAPLSHELGNGSSTAPVFDKVASVAISPDLIRFLSDSRINVTDKLIAAFTETGIESMSDLYELGIQNVDETATALKDGMNLIENKRFRKSMIISIERKNEFPLNYLKLD